MTIGVGVATIETRKESLKKTIESLQKALKIYQYIIYIQADYEQPEGMTNVIWSNIGNEKGDARKFYYSDMPHKYWFFCDDDLIYPADYIVRSLNHLEKHPNTVLSYHGRTIKPRPIESYYRHSRIDGFRCLGEVKNYQRVDPNGTLGTGVMFFKSGTIKINFEDFKYPNMADIWMAKFAIDQKVPMIVCPHKEGWIKDIPSDGIFQKHQFKDKIQAEVYNSIIL